MKRRKRWCSLGAALSLALAACGGDGDEAADATQPTATEPGLLPSTTPSTTEAPSTASGSSTPTTVVSAESGRFPTAVFAGLGEEPVSDELAAELQEVLDSSARGDGITATLITPAGDLEWRNGLRRRRSGDGPERSDVHRQHHQDPGGGPGDAAGRAGELGLDDLAADRLPPDLEFDTNGATIVDLLSMRSGIAEYLADEDELREALLSDPLRVWTLEEKLATVAPERGPVGQEWEYIGTNYLLLGLIVEHVTGRPVAEVLRSGVLDGDGYERLIYQPDERPTDPMAMPLGASADTFDQGGGYLPSIANVTMFTSEGAMASDSPSLARWFRALCAGDRSCRPASLDEMTDFDKRPEYGLGIMDRQEEYGWDSGALGHTGLAREGYRTAALCFQNPGMVVVVLANAEHDVDTIAGNLWQAAST